MSAPAPVTVTRMRYLRSRQLPLGWLYETYGPDGKKFTNTSLVELRRVLREFYGRGLQIKEEW